MSKSHHIKSTIATTALLCTSSWSYDSQSDTWDQLTHRACFIITIVSTTISSLVRIPLPVWQNWFFFRTETPRRENLKLFSENHTSLTWKTKLCERTTYRQTNRQTDRHISYIYLCCLSVCLFVCLCVCLSVTILDVTILKNPYKTKTNKAKMLIFWCMSQFCMSRFWKIHIKQKLMKQGYYFFCGRYLP